MALRIQQLRVEDAGLYTCAKKGSVVSRHTVNLTVEYVPESEPKTGTSRLLTVDTRVENEVITLNSHECDAVKCANVLN